MTPAETRDKARELMLQMYGNVRASWPGFQRREGQEAMMETALATFLNCKQPGATTQGEQIALVEGPTGTGKTLGYLLAAIAAANTLEKKVVISTATVALQDQLMLKDLPRLKECAGIDMSFEILKGRQRYVCLQKLARNGEPDPELLELFEDAPAITTRTRRKGGAQGAASSGATEQSAMAFVSEMSSALDKGRWDGDRDKWPGSVADANWLMIAADSGSCTRRNCAYFKQCAFYEARKRAAGARIQVANHALVLATLVNDSNTIDPGATAFVFDEGHNLPEIGLDQFTSEMKLHSAMRALARTRTVLGKARPFAASDADWRNSVPAATDAAQECETILQRLLADVLDDPVFRNATQRRFEDGVLPDTWAQVVDQLASTLGVVMAAAVPMMDRLQDQGAEEDQGKKDRAQMLASEWAPWLSTLGSARTLLKHWQSSERVPLAKWITVSQDTGTVSLSASPLTAAKALHDHVWSKAGAALVTSATLTACGSFDFFTRLSGLNRYPMRTELVAPAAFDYQRQARLCIPKLRTSPKDGAAFTAELVEVFPGLLEGFNAGQLCLFASRRQMEAVFEGLPNELRSRVLVQGTAPRSMMLAEHRRLVEKGWPSIMFGLQSLGEGIDLPGALCEHVVIEKIPFAPPESPVDAALGEWLESQQRDAFAEVSVPKAGVKLAQWVGRAVRTIDDQAVITICDTRLRTARYGRRLLQGLPAMPRIEHPSKAGF